jgi:hypothetical protein
VIQLAPIESHVTLLGRKGDIEGDTLALGKYSSAQAWQKMVAIRDSKLQLEPAAQIKIGSP